MIIIKIFSIIEKRIVEIVLAIICAIIVGIFVVIEPNIYMIATYGIGSIIIISIFGVLINKISSLRDESSNMRIEDTRIRDELSAIRDENTKIREKLNLFENKEKDLNKVEIIYNENITNYEGMVSIIRFDEPILYTEASVPYLEFKYYIFNRGVFDVNINLSLKVEESNNQYQLGEKLSDIINIPHQNYGSTNIKIQPISQKFIDELSRKGNLAITTKLNAHVTGYREFYIPSTNRYIMDSMTLLANDKIQNKLFLDFQGKIFIDDIRRFLPDAGATNESFDNIISEINRYHGNGDEPILPLFEECMRALIGISNFWFRKYTIYNKRRISDEEFINLLGELSMIINSYITICLLAIRNDRIKSSIDGPRRNGINKLIELYDTFGKNYNQFIEEINRKIPQIEQISKINLIPRLNL